MKLNDLKYSRETGDTISEYIVPVKVTAEKLAENSNILLEDNSRQALAIFNQKDRCNIKKGGYVVLDMGCEIHGGAEIVFERFSEREKTVRVVFGESVMEALGTLGVKNATNNHSVRDISFKTTGFGSVKLGNTGYRFIKIEAVECDISLKTVQGIFVHKNIEYSGSFKCNDEEINKIWKVGAYTVFLNMQDYLWDGIKRDRLVWMGDMHPETLTILSVFGYDTVIPKSLDLVMNSTPPGEWMNTFPTYTSWWVINQKDLFMHSGDFKYLLDRKEYLFDVLNQILGCVSDGGELDYPDYFCDWSSRNTEDEIVGAYAVTVMGLKSGKVLCDYLGNAELSKKCEESVKRLLSKKLIMHQNKQTAALYALSGGADSRKVSKELLLKGGGRGLSTFLGGYVLRTIARGGYMTEAINIMKEYWGAMLKLGATTFWEDFDLSWVTEKTVGIDKIVPDKMIDVHGDFGKFCYMNFRHSLCHGWASGPTSFLSQTVTGIEVLEPGFKKVRIRPNIGELKFIKTKYPTPFGMIEVEADKTGAKIIVPDGVELIKSRF